MDPNGPANAGTIVEVGQTTGRLGCVDPTGRYVAVVDNGAARVLDIHDGLRPRGSFALPRRSREIAVHPGGGSIAVLGEDLTVDLWTGDALVGTFPGDPGGRAADWRRSIERSGGQCGWLQFTPDGSYLLFGDTVPDGPARLSLLDAATLTPLDAVSSLESSLPGFGPIRDWGEGVEIARVAPSTVAVTSCGGDDTLFLIIVEVVDGRLRVHGTEPGVRSLLDDVPGERVTGIALSGGDEIILLDSDGFLTASSWRDPASGARYQVRADDLPRHSGAESDPGVGHGPADAEDAYVVPAGPLWVRGRYLAVALDRERRVDGRFTWQFVALAVLDVVTGQWLGRCELPGAHRPEPIKVDRGVVWQSVGDLTRVFRWLPPDG